MKVAANKRIDVRASINNTRMVNRITAYDDKVAISLGGYNVVVSLDGTMTLYAGDDKLLGKTSIINDKLFFDAHDLKSDQFMVTITPNGNAFTVYKTMITTKKTKDGCGFIVEVEHPGYDKPLASVAIYEVETNQTNGDP